MFGRCGGVWPSVWPCVARVWPVYGPCVARVWPLCGPCVARVWPVCMYIYVVCTREGYSVFVNTHRSLLLLFYPHVSSFIYFTLAPLYMLFVQKLFWENSFTEKNQKIEKSQYFDFLDIF